MMKNKIIKIKKAKYCMYCGEKLRKEDHLEGCCNRCYYP